MLVHAQDRGLDIEVAKQDAGPARIFRSDELDLLHVLTVEEQLGEGIPHEDVFLYEDALRHGRSILIAHVDDDRADQAREIVEDSGASDIETLREQWWADLRDDERNYYHTGDRDFDRDEATYRRGFQAALHPQRRGRGYTDVAESLRSEYGTELDTSFREGYERGLAYHGRFRERRNG